jgi:hypothetical protein
MYVLDYFYKSGEKQKQITFCFSGILVHDGSTAHRKNLQWQHTLERCKNKFYVILVTVH